jgi:hypothetical protein
MLTEPITHTENSIEDIDNSVEDYIRRARGENSIKFLMPYWYQCKDEMLEILQDNYPVPPKWVNYDSFLYEMMLLMAETLFDTFLYVDTEDDMIEVNFSHIIGIALCSRYLDTGGSDIWDSINNLNIIMKVNLRGG